MDYEKIVLSALVLVVSLLFGTMMYSLLKAPQYRAACYETFKDKPTADILQLCE
jgi:hypothetical protein